MIFGIIYSYILIQFFISILSYIKKRKKKYPSRRKGEPKKPTKNVFINFKRRILIEPDDYTLINALLQIFYDLFSLWDFFSHSFYILPSIHFRQNSFFMLFSYIIIRYIYILRILFRLFDFR